jgi:hypothetical protein
MDLVPWDYTADPLPDELRDLGDVSLEGALAASLPLLIDPEPIVAPLHVPPPLSPAAYKRQVHNVSERERRATLARLLRELGRTVGVGPDQPLIEVIRAAIAEVALQQRFYVESVKELHELTRRNQELRSDPLVLLRGGNVNGVGRAHRAKVPIALRQLLPHNRCGRRERPAIAGKRRPRS